MKKRPLFWKLYPGLIFVIVASLLLSALYATREMKSLYLEEIQATLVARAHIVEKYLRTLDSHESARIDQVCRMLGEISDTRITVIARGGKVLGDSQEDPSLMENHSDRPEIRPAIRGEIGVESRFSNTLQIDMIYVAIPYTGPDSNIGVIRTALPMTAIERVLSALYWKLSLGGMLILLLASAIGWVLISRVTTSLTALRQGAEQFAQGDFENRLPLGDSEEISGLAEAMNKMAAQLDRRIRTIVNQRNEQDAILSSMSEGVIALDSQERIVSLNLAASKLLGFSSREEAIGVVIQEALRSSELFKLLSGELDKEGQAEIVIARPGSSERTVLVNAAKLINEQKERVGIVLVLNDITRMNRLERVRRDFVANVSHELRTPVTAIRGAVETMIDSGMTEDPDANRFATMIFNHADRLNRIIEDLLTLARLESEDRKEPSPALETVALREIVGGAISSCQAAADEKRVTLASEVDTSLEVTVNPLQIEQAVRNLVENAIKYCDPGASVTVRAEKSGAEVIIHVIDTGWGIEPRHLPRLFERFYRVDAARDRDSGGTGLGLAIVRHIALSHGGRVTVESVPGNGSTFKIHLPATT